MIAVRFLENLQKLIITAKLPMVINPSLIKVSEDESILLDKFCIRILPGKAFRLEPGLIKASEIINVEDGVFVSLTIEAKVCEPIISPELDDWSPPMDELMNDWIFCHQHGSKPPRLEENSSQKKPILSIPNHVKSLLRKQSMMSTILLESDNKKDNILIRVINPKIYIGVDNCLSPSMMNQVILQMATALQYKSLSSHEDLEELKKYRHSFHVEWYIIQDHVLEEIICTLDENCLFKLTGSREMDEDGFKEAFL